MTDELRAQRRALIARQVAAQRERLTSKVAAARLMAAVNQQRARKPPALSKISAPRKVAAKKTVAPMVRRAPVSQSLPKESVVELRAQAERCGADRFGQIERARLLRLAVQKEAAERREESPARPEPAPVAEPVAVAVEAPPSAPEPRPVPQRSRPAKRSSRITVYRAVAAMRATRQTKPVAKPTPVKFSPARQFVQLAWDHVQEATDHSWQRLNSAMHQALRLAVNGGLRFENGDIDHFSQKMDMYRWIGENGVESLYAQAVASGNLSACHAIEAYLGREPFLLKDGERIYVGHKFEWEGEQVTCTSFSDTETLIACSYRWVEGKKREPCGTCGQTPYGSSGSQKIKKRYSISLAEIKAGAKADRAAKKAIRDAKKKAEEDARLKAEAERAEYRRKAKEEFKREQEESRLRARERIASLCSPETRARTATVGDALAAGLCEEQVIQFCNEHLQGRRSATIQEVIDAPVTRAHWLDSIEKLIRHLSAPGVRS